MGGLHDMIQWLRVLKGRSHNSTFIQTSHRKHEIFHTHSTRRRRLEGPQDFLLSLLGNYGIHKQRFYIKKNNIFSCFPKLLQFPKGDVRKLWDPSNQLRLVEWVWMIFFLQRDVCIKVELWLRPCKTPNNPII